MNCSTNELIVSMKDFEMVLKSILHQRIIDSKAISLDC